MCNRALEILDEMIAEAEKDAFLAKCQSRYSAQSHYLDKADYLREVRSRIAALTTESKT